MAVQQKQLECKTCKRNTLFQRETFSEGIGCLLTVLTCGLFLPIWFLLELNSDMKPYRCQQCGQKG